MNRAVRRVAGRARVRTFAAAALALLSGCSTLYPRVQLDEAAAAAVVPAAPVAQAMPASGAIFDAARYRPLFEDHRARLPGDTLLVNIVEKVSASQSSKSTIDKNATATANVSALPGVAPNSFTRAGAAGTSSNTFAGKGETANTNDFSGSVTVVVRQVLPNGHLLVAGEKQIGVNANVDVLRFTGQVDPRAILPGNSVPSTQVANVRVEHRGRGAQAEAQRMGWLQRVFMSVLPI